MSYLRLEAVHDIDNEDCDVTEGGASRAQVGEGLVTRRVDDEETRNAHIDLIPQERKLCG